MENKTEVVKNSLDTGNVLGKAFRMAVKYAPVLLVLGALSCSVKLIFPEVNQPLRDAFLKNYGAWKNMVPLIIKYLVAGIIWLIISAIAYYYVNKNEIEEKNDKTILLKSFSVLASKQFFLYLFVMVRYSITVAIGTILFIVPGIIWGLRYSFAGVIALLKPDGVDPARPFEESARITDGYKGDMFALSLSLGLALLPVSLLVSVGEKAGFPIGVYAGVLVMPVLISFHIVLLYILLDRKKAIVEKTGTGVQTAVKKDGNAETKIIIGSVVFVLVIAAAIWLDSVKNPERAIKLQDNISVSLNWNWSVQTDKVIPGDYKITFPGTKLITSLVTRKLNGEFLSSTDTEINDKVRAVLDPLSLEMKRVEKFGFKNTDTPYSRGEIDINGKKWAVCEYRKEAQNKTYVWKGYYTFLGNSVQEVSYLYSFDPSRTGASETENIARKDEETVIKVLGRFSAK